MALFSGCTCCIGRRGFLLGGLAAAATSLAAPAIRAQSQAPAIKKPGTRIDVHHHFLPPQYMKEEHERISFKHGGVSADRLLSWKPELSLEAMDQQRHRNRDRLGVDAGPVVRRRPSRPPAVADVERLRGRADPHL